MPLFRGELHTAHYEPGEVIEIDDDQVHLYDGDVAAGFLTPVSDLNHWSSWQQGVVSADDARTALGTPDAEALSTVGQADPE